MSDLQCPVRLLVVQPGRTESGTSAPDGGGLTAAGRERSRRLAAVLAGERVARVWSAPSAPAVQTAEEAASLLGVDVVVRDGLAGLEVGEQPDGPELLDRSLAVLEEIADLHRGEAVLVVAHPGVLSFALTRVARGDGPVEGADDPVLELTGDSDGWVARPWRGRGSAEDRRP